MARPISRTNYYLPWSVSRLTCFSEGGQEKCQDEINEYPFPKSPLDSVISIEIAENYRERGDRRVVQGRVRYAETYNGLVCRTVRFEYITGRI